MLRRPDPDDRPYRGLAFSWPAHRPAHRLWQPLVALCLFDNAVLRLWAQYRVEPGRRVDQRFDQVEWTILTPDGEIEVEVHDTGQFTVGREGEARLRRFLVALAPRLEAAAARQGKPAERPVVAPSTSLPPVSTHTEKARSLSRSTTLRQPVTM